MSGTRKHKIGEDKAGKKHKSSLMFKTKLGAITEEDEGPTPKNPEVKQQTASTENPLTGSTSTQFTRPRKQRAKSNTEMLLPRDEHKPKVSKQ